MHHSIEETPTDPQVVEVHKEASLVVLLGRHTMAQESLQHSPMGPEV